MNFINPVSAKPKPFFEVGKVGEDFGQEVMQSAAVIKQVLSRPIDGLNIVTTHPSKTLDDIQLYGWKSPVRTHTDATGYIFFVPLEIESNDYLQVGTETHQLEVGMLYALDDYFPHSTAGLGKVVAAFYGSVPRESISRPLLNEVLKAFQDKLNP